MNNLVVMPFTDQAQNAHPVHFELLFCDLICKGYKSSRMRYPTTRHLAFSSIAVSTDGRRVAVYRCRGIGEGSNSMSVFYATNYGNNPLSLFFQD